MNKYWKMSVEYLGAVFYGVRWAIITSYQIYNAFPCNKTRTSVFVLAQI